MVKSGRRYSWKDPTPTPSDPSVGVASQGKGAAQDDDNNDDGFDLEWRKYTMEELYVMLRTSPSGLTSARAAAALVSMGGNELEAKKESRLSKLLPVAVEVAAAAAMVVGLARGGGRGVFAALVALLAANLFVSLAQSYSAGIAAAAALVARLVPFGRTCWVLRNGVWSTQDEAALVLGDVIWIKSGDVVPADARLLKRSKPMTIKIDESALTGDPLPAAKRPGEAVYAGSACVKGEAAAVVVAGGAHTYLADAVRLADATTNAVCRVIVEVLNAIWNACVVATCFVMLVEDYAPYSTGDIAVLLLSNGIYFGFTGALLSIDWESIEAAEQSRRPRRPERDPEQLMRRLETLREQSKISEETVQRCREMFGTELVCDELVAELARHFRWVTPAVEDRRDNCNGRPSADG